MTRVRWDDVRQPLIVDRSFSHREIDMSEPIQPLLPEGDHAQVLARIRDELGDSYSREAVLKILEEDET